MGGNPCEGVDRTQICDIDQKGLQPSVRGVIKDTVFSPSEVSADHFILISHQWMKRVGDAESTAVFTDTTCSC